MAEPVRQQTACRICAVVVLYREEAASSRTITSLKQALAESPELTSELVICVYDNTPQPYPIPEPLLPCEVHVFQPGRNKGLPPAYNKALEIAGERCPWLLLLDSDTELTASFLNGCIQDSRELDHDADIAAILPHVVEGPLLHSPRWATAMRRQPVPLSFAGPASCEVIALNSGSLLRVAALRRIGAFTSEFWLDYLDYWLFRVLHKNGYRVFISQYVLQHSLSFADPSARMSVARYKNMLDAELYFTHKYGSTAEKIRLPFVLIKRAIRFTVPRVNGPFLHLLLGSLLKLLSRPSPPRPPE